MTPGFNELTHVFINTSSEGLYIGNNRDSTYVVRLLVILLSGRLTPTVISLFAFTSKTFKCFGGKNSECIEKWTHEYFDEAVYQNFLSWSIDDWNHGGNQYFVMLFMAYGTWNSMNEIVVTLLDTFCWTFLWNLGYIHPETIIYCLAVSKLPCPTGYQLRYI